MTESLIHLNYPLDKKLLIEESIKAKETACPYGNDPRMPGKTLDNWLISRHTSEYIEQIMKDFEVQGRPRFYWLEANAHLVEHVDYNTTCSLNFVLSDNIAPVTIEGKDYFYEQALLNTTRMHSVNNGATERLILKISLFDESFEDLSARLRYKK